MVTNAQLINFETKRRQKTDLSINLLLFGADFALGDKGVGVPKNWAEVRF